jgi:hypothetical protein
MANVLPDESMMYILCNLFLHGDSNLNRLLLGVAAKAI